MHLTTIDWAIVASVMTVTLATGLWLTKRAAPPGEVRAHITIFLWAIAAVYSLMFAIGYLLYGETVLAIHWFVVAAIAGWTAWRKISKSGSSTGKR